MSRIHSGEHSGEHLGATLESVRPGVPGGLISASGFAAMQPVAELLPSRLGQNAFGFEIPLTRHPLTADLLLAVDPAAGDLAAVEGHAPAALLRREPAWRVLARLREGLEDSPSLRGKIANLWLEFDTRGSAPLLPSLFFMPVAQISRNRQDHLRAFEISREAVGLVALQRPAALDSDLLRRCFEVLPAAGSIFQIGVMNSRPNRRVRICAALHNPRTILEFLAAIELPIDLGVVERHVRWLRRYTDRLRLNLDLDQGVRPKLGIECYLHGFRAMSRWPQLLAALSRVGACCASKAQDLLAYPGVDHLTVQQATGLESYHRAADWLGTHAVLERRRYLHHVKVVVEPDQEIEAKAYLAVEHRWRRPSAMPPEAFRVSSSPGSQSSGFIPRVGPSG